MRTIAFNGKFFGAAPTGVHRVAEQLVAATDAPAGRTMLVPKTEMFVTVDGTTKTCTLPLPFGRPTCQ